MRSKLLPVENENCKTKWLGEVCIMYITLL